MIDFIIASFIVGLAVSFYMNNKKAVDERAEKVKDLFR